MSICTGCEDIQVPNCGCDTIGRVTGQLVWKSINCTTAEARVIVAKLF